MKQIIYGFVGIFIGLLICYGVVIIVKQFKKNKNMKNENFWNGFTIGFFTGGIVGIIILDLVVRFSK